MRSVFLHGFRIGMRQWRITAIVYFLQLCLALTLGMQVYDVLQASIGHSLEINKLLLHYDHTVITDFLKVHGASITPLIGQLRWLLLVWLLFSVFTDGGLLYCATMPQQATVRSFWQGGATYFTSFLKISLFFLTLALLWTIVTLLPIALYFEPSIEVFPSEKYSVWLAFFLLALWLKGLAILFVWSVLSRWQRIQTEASIMACIRKAGLVLLRNKLRFIGLMAGFALFQLLLVAVYFVVEAYTGMVSPWYILLVFLIQQAFVFFRIQIRQMMYAAIGQVAGSGNIV